MQVVADAAAMTMQEDAVCQRFGIEDVCDDDDNNSMQLRAQPAR